MRRATSKGLTSRFSDFKRWKPELLCVSLGGPTDHYWQHDLMNLLQQSQIPTVYILQANATGMIQGESVRAALRALYSAISAAVASCQS